MVLLLSLYTENVKGGSVFIYNNMHHGHYLKVYCKSGDNNLGYHVRRPGGFYNWSFSDHIMGTSLFWCHFYRGHNFKDHVVFEVYNGKSYSHRDNWVRWSARENGLYQSVNGEEPFHFRYSWDGRI